MPIRKESTNAANNDSQYNLNIRLAEEISKHDLVDASQLQIILSECQKDGTNVGQVLMQRRLLNMENFISIMKYISGQSLAPEIVKKASLTSSSTKRVVSQQGSSEGKLPELKSTPPPRNVVSPNTRSALSRLSPPSSSTRSSSSTPSQPASNNCKDSSVSSPEDNGGLGSLPTAGTIFAGYEIIGEIARGGMGVVYRARQQNTQRMVALKVLLHAQNETAVKRFLREAEATAQLQHPNIIPIYNTGEHNHYYYFTMKYIAGGTFQNLLSPDVPLQHRIKIIAKICQALQTAHDKQIIHRDLKPSNILLDEAGEPYLTDFGLAKFMDSTASLTQTGTTLGTPSYMSPEQVEGNKKLIGTCSDIYSMGAILYEALTGQLPFQAETLSDLYNKILEEEPIKPTELNPQVSQALEDICLRALAKNPKIRYASAGEMAADLLSTLSSSKLRTRRRVRVTSTLTKWHRRRSHNWKKLMPYILIIGALILASSLVYYFYQRQQWQAEQRILNIEKICQEAQDRCYRGEYVETANWLQQQIEQINDSSRLYAELAWVYQKSQMPVQAKQAMQKAHELDSNNFELRYRYSELLFQEGDYAQAIKILQPCLEQPLVPSMTLRLYAALSLKLNQLSQSQAALKKAQDQERQELAQIMPQVKQAVENKSYETALTLLDKLITKNPACEFAYLERAQLYRQIKQLDQALKDLAYCLELNPCLEYAKMQSQWLEEVGYLEQSYTVYTRLLEKFPHWSSNHEIIQAMAALEFKLGKYQQSYQSYAKLPRSPSMNIQLARCAFYQQDYVQCEKHIQEATGQLSPQEQAELHYYEGYLFQQKGKIEASISAFLQALQLQSPQTSDIYWQLGQLYWKNKQSKEASDWLQKAAPAFPEQIDIHLLLANAATEEKRFDIAISAWSRCIQLEPWNSPYYHARSKAYSQLKNWKAAENDLLKCLQISGENLEPLLDLLINMFAQEFLCKAHDLKMIFSFLNEDHEDPAKLFLKEETEMFTQYLQDWKRQNQQQQRQQISSFDEKRAKVLIQGLVSSDSSSVQSLVESGLLSMYQETKLHDMLENELAKQHSPVVKQRLQKAWQLVKNRYLDEYKIILRQLLVRYYSAKDAKAIQIMSSLDKIAISCLLTILKDDQEPEMLRFLAARMLMDLRHPEGYQALQKLAESSTGLPMVYAYILLLQQGQTPNIDNSQITSSAQYPHPFVRALLAKYLPWQTYHQLMQKTFIHDSDVRVRILAADRLRSAGFASATSVLWEAYQDPNPEVRTFVVYSLWDLKNFSSKATKEQIAQINNEALQNLPKLINSAKDTDYHVRRAALMRMEQWDHPEITAAMLPCLTDVYPVRLQAIISLGTKMELHKIAKIVHDQKAPLVFRLAAMLGLSKGLKTNSVDTQMIGILMPLLEEKDRYMRVVIFLILGRANQKTFLDFIRSRLKHPDSEVRRAALVGLLSNNQTMVLPNIEKMLKDSEPEVRFVAATGYTSIAGYFYPEQMSEIRKKILQSKDEKTIRGGALGFNKILYDCVSYDTDMASQWDWQQGYVNFLEQLLREIHESSFNGMSSGQLSKEDKKLHIYRSMDEMTSYMDAAVEFAPDEPHYRLERGVIHFSQKRYVDAVRDFEKAGELDPSSDTYKLWLACAYLHTQKYDKGLELIDDYLKVYPWSIMAYDTKSQLLEKINRMEEAQAANIRKKLIATLKVTSGL